MQHEFKFRLKQQVVATDYDTPPKKHNGVVTRRWLEEPRNYETPHLGLGATLEEHYDVLVIPEVGKGKKKAPKPQSCEFLAKDLVSAPRI